MSSPDPRAVGRAPSGKSVAAVKPTSPSSARADAPDDDTSAAAGGATGLMARIGRLWDRDVSFSTAQAQALLSARLTDVAANRLAREWSAAYLAADARVRRALLTMLAQTAQSIEDADIGGGQRLFKRLNALPDGLRFLVALRTDMLKWRKQVPGLPAFDSTLQDLLSAWFDVGLLELRRLTWDSPASLLEKLIVYEAVHEIQSWDDLRHRVAGDRRCYAYFHPKMPDVPLIFVEVAFSPTMADNVQTLLDTQAPSGDLDRARWAIFYSISNTQAGLRGISFGNFLLKRVIDAMVEDLPKLKSFATLSPIPGFNDWLAKQDAQAIEKLLREKPEARPRGRLPDGQRWVARLQKAARGSASEVVQRAAFKFAAHYLSSMKNGQPLDPVARFHLGNGARVERLNWAADRSAKGIAQSSAMMVNYLYALDDLDDNLARLNDGTPVVSRAIARLR
jgi:malonyl-CoA decarboxylase